MAKQDSRGLREDAHVRGGEGRGGVRQFLRWFRKRALLKDSSLLMGGLLGILELNLPDCGGHEPITYLYGFS